MEGIRKKDLQLASIILAEDVDDKAKYALSLVPIIEFKTYKLNIQII